MTQLGVLHTNSAYVTSAPLLPRIGEDIKMQRLMAQINALENKENSFAQKFGYSTIADFIAGVRKILQDSPADMKALQQFSSNNLQRLLESLKQANSDMFINQKITLRLQGDSKKIGNLFNAHGGGEGITWDMSAPNMIILAEWNTPMIKSIVNKMVGVRLKTNSNNTEKLIQLLKGQAANAVKVTIGEKEETIDQFVANNAVSPFSLKPTEFQDLVKNNPELAKTFKIRILNFITNTLCAGASDDFRRAVKVVMDSKFSSLSDYAFFMGGKGWSTHALGAFGELQTAILFQYIANKTPNKMLAMRIAQIIGDERNGYNQQFHTDIEILKAFGIQVKNYGSAKDFKTGMEKTVNVHLHPSEVAALGASEGVTDYLVNSYFNTSIGSYPASSLNDFFKSHASELLNLDFNPQIPDQVSFYMIGSNFIPGSAILKQAFQEFTLKVNTTISGTTGNSDEGYRAGEHPPFLKWWHGNKYIGWNPTGQNSISAWDGKVSIATSFTYSAIFEGTYKLF